MGRMSSGSLTMPVPMSQNQMRFTMAAANQGLSGAVSQAAKRLRGSSSGPTLTGSPAGTRGCTTWRVRGSRRLALKSR